MTRTTTATVNFTRPFALRNVAGVWAAGAYDVVTDEATIDNLTFVAWHRTATAIHLHRNGTTQVVGIDPAELDELLQRDVN